MSGDDKMKRIMSGAVLFLGAFSAVIGIYGVVMVVKMGLMPVANPMGHSREYEDAWRLFFLIFIGLPSLAALVGGLAPWVFWFRNRRRSGRGAKRPAP